MPDRTTSPDESRIRADDTSEATTDPTEAGAADERQRIFAAQFDEVMTGFGQACAARGIDIALAMAIHPDFGPQQPLVFVRGHLYDAAALAASVVRQFKTELLEPLTTEPG